MDPLSITASIAGIVTAAREVCKVLGKIQDAPRSMGAISTEIEHIGLVFRALQSLIDSNTTLNLGRAALIQLEDVSVILTQTVLVFSELQALIGSLPPASQHKATWRLRWSRKERAINHLVNQLQRQKTSLSLLLQIIQWYAPAQLRVRDTLCKIQTNRRSLAIMTYRRATQGRRYIFILNKY